MTELAKITAELETKMAAMRELKAQHLAESDYKPNTNRTFKYRTSPAIKAHDLAL